MFDLIELIGLVTLLLAIIVRFTGDVQNATYFMACACAFLLVAAIKHLKDVKGSL